MNKKKLLTLVLTLALIGAVGVGATLAYFTDNATASNVVTMGRVDITLTEEATGKAKPIKDGLSFENIVPGETIDKKPVITVAGDSQDCYVRAEVLVESDDIAPEKLTQLKDALMTSIKSAPDNKWAYGKDDYYYYTEKLSKNGTATLFSTVTIPAEWDNTVAGKGFTIKIKAEAIQAEGLAKDFFNADGFSWNIAEDKIIEYKVAE